MNKQGHEDADIIGFIVDHVRDQGYPPTITEIADKFGLARATVAWHLSRMEREGKMIRGGSGPTPSARARAIRITEDGMKLIPHPMEQF